MGSTQESATLTRRTATGDMDRLHLHCALGDSKQLYKHISMHGYESSKRIHIHYYKVSLCRQSMKAGRSVVVDIIYGGTPRIVQVWAVLW
jgi:hypothetical protein